MPAARSVGKLIVGDVIGGVVTAPLFWYTRGAVDAAGYCLRLIQNRWYRLGLGVWLKNLLVPMFGQKDAAGIIISFFVRFFQIIARGIVMVFWIVFVVLLYAAYLIAPFIIVFALLGQLFGSPSS